MAGKASGEDPIEKIGRLIDEKLENALGARDRKAQEEKDPWARIEGMIDRSISKQFEEFKKGLTDLDDDDDDERGGGPPKLGILGL